MHELDKRYSIFLQNERNRLNEIENLHKDGNLNDVFRTLIQDCDVEGQNPIHYILQLMKDSSSFEKLSQNHLLGLISKEHQYKEAIPCSSPKGATRQKYCTSNRHKGKSVKIRIHNQLALCRECFVLQTGQSVIEKNEIIYRKEDRQLIRELLSNAENQTKDMGIQKQSGDLYLNNENTQEVNVPLQDIKKHKKGVHRGSKIAKKLLLIKQSIDNRKSRAATTIQTFYRYFKHRKKQSHVECIEAATNKPEPDDSFSRQKLEELLERLESTSKLARLLKLNSNVVKLKKPKNMMINLRGEKTRRKQVCEANACSICNESKRTTPGGRHNIVCIPCYQEIAPSIIAMTEEMKTLFERVDRLQVGSIPKTTFTRIIRDIWIKEGYELLVDEELSIINQFQSGQDGHIDYIKFLQVFAKQSRFGCNHGRIMCSICNQNKNSKKNQRTDVRKRGFQICQNLENTLSQRKRPDQSCNAQLSDVEDSFREWRSSRKSTHHQIIAISNPISSRQQKRNHCANNNNVQRRKLHFTEDAPKNIDYRNQDPIVVPTKLKPPQSFSAHRLSLLLDENVKHTREQKDINVRHTHKCPICRFKFFDLTLLRNHISRRHSLEDLEYVLNQATDNEKRNMTPSLVQWGERFALVPPMEPPVHFFICQKHVPPHPNCRRCQESFQQTCMYSPIRFYRSAFVQIKKSLGDGNSDKDKENNQEMYLRFHFSLNNSENAVVFHGGNGTERRMGKIVSICNDGREQNFVGVQEYLPIQGTENEVCLDFNVIFVRFEHIVDRQLVLSLEEDKDREEVCVKLGNQNKDEVKICKYELKCEQKANN